MAEVFLYGTLRHLPLLEVVLGRRPEAVAPARLPGHRVVWAEGEAFPLIEPGGEAADGLVVSGLTDEDLSRLDFYELGFGYGTKVMQVETPEGPVGARVYWPDPGLWTAGAAWDLEAWVRDWGALTLETAREVMARHGLVSAREVARLYPFLRARAWSRQLAGRQAPQTRRSPAGAAAPDIEGRSGGHDGFFQLRPIRASVRRFDGSRSETVEREAFIGFDAALVLPYDPVRDRVLVIEQFRYGPTMRGDACARVLEPIAGMVDAGEEPLETARREAAEEAGLTLTDIRPMTGVYASPGYSTDFFHCFLAICDLDFDSGHIGGHPEEHEDIRSHVLSFGDAMDLVTSGEINVAPLAMMLLWLAREREEMRASSGT